MFDRKTIITFTSLGLLVALVTILLRDYSRSLFTLGSSEKYSDPSSTSTKEILSPLYRPEEDPLSPAEANVSDPRMAGASSGNESGVVGVGTEPIYTTYTGGSSTDSGCFPRDGNTAADLLPEGAASQWASKNPNGSGSVSDAQFLTAGWHVGVVTNPLRNANLQIRSEPPNPILKGVSIWNQSTIEPDVSRRPLEIGSN